ncbi:hypothetical protein K505DRAFT_417777 [Melanomma pulvis-pyrius CBS 109.77]|uniref:Uncharacterized protein n=1 Tax=Melanomma pulvis-pyrius CBS 109.77 TaxID=1314802 RepID=A0A6A6XB46_9PLEO|nr:hypothetical protein K505DRAFT_417777 [Melanomma pulvis-pyrius CBS 109.77]
MPPVCMYNPIQPAQAHPSATTSRRPTSLAPSCPPKSRETIRPVRPHRGNKLNQASVRRRTAAGAVARMDRKRAVKALLAPLQHVRPCAECARPGSPSWPLGPPHPCTPAFFFSMYACYLSSGRVVVVVAVACRGEGTLGRRGTRTRSGALRGVVRGVVVGSGVGWVC